MKHKTKQIIFYNGNFVPESEAHISVMTHGLNYGTGIFEGIRAYYNEESETLCVFRMVEHYERLLDSAKLLFITIPHTVSELCDITVELLKKNFAGQDIYIRPLAFKSSLTVSNFDLRTLEDSFVIYTVPLGRYLAAEEGIRVNTSTWQRVRDNAIPPRGKITGTYANTALAKTESLVFGFDEAIFLDSVGHAVEGSAENLFMVRHGKVYTPPVTDDILVGITRDTIIKLCSSELDIIVEERSIDRSELYQADEIFLVGTGAEVSPVREVDGHTIGDSSVGEIAAAIRKRYNALVRGQTTANKQWITAINKP